MKTKYTVYARFGDIQGEIQVAAENEAAAIAQAKKLLPRRFWLKTGIFCVELA